jgi:hypothetical protein
MAHGTARHGLNAHLVSCLAFRALWKRGSEKTAKDMGFQARLEQVYEERKTTFDSFIGDFKRHLQPCEARYKRAPQGRGK